MSRGHGRIQNFILEQLNGKREGGPFIPRRLDEPPDRQEGWPVSVLAGLYAFSLDEDSATPHLRASFRRAAHRLAEQGLVNIGTLRLPTRRFEDGVLGSAREVLVVWPVGVEWTHERHMNTVRAMAVFGAR